MANSILIAHPSPITPPGIRVLVHEKPIYWTAWSPHADDGWYTGPALDSSFSRHTWIAGYCTFGLRETGAFPTSGSRLRDGSSGVVDARIFKFFD
jgi:hypothetical protein